MSSNTKQFSNLFTNTYSGDVLAEFIRLYNDHNHTLVSLNSFVTYRLQQGQQISFVPLSNLADPFNQLALTTPLAITKVSTTSLTLNTQAFQTVAGAISYVEDNVYKQITGVRSIEGTNTLVWIPTTEEQAGTILANTLLKLLQKSYNSVYKFGDTTKLPTNSISDVSEAILEYNIRVSLDAGDLYLFTQEGNVTAANSQLTLNRGALYKFTFSQEVITKGGWWIVQDLVSAAYPLKRYKEGITEIKDTAENIVGLNFYVPVEAPSLLFYQSTVSDSRYGELKIVGGELTADNAIYSFWQQSTSINITSQVPDYIIPFTISTSTVLRLIAWNILPIWSSALNTGRAFLQLQIQPIGQPIQALSELIYVDGAGRQSISINQSVLIPADSMIFCAVYSPYQIKEIFQELDVTYLS